jgi:glycosyltransferase involved in cell wall biosynthesis
MIACNEASMIRDALESVKPLVSEMIVVDTGSTDDTVAIAEAAGAKVYPFGWTGSFSDARNASIEHATGDWIFILDADETISEADVEKIRTIAGEAPYGAYTMHQWTYLYDPAVIGWTPNPGAYGPAAEYPGYLQTNQVRLFPNRKDIRYSGEVHEGVDLSCRDAGVPVATADIPIHHFGRVKNGDRSVRKGRLYLELGRKKIAERTTDVEDSPAKHHKDSINDKVDILQSQIDSMNARLAIRRERLIAEFLNLESVLSQLQSEQDFINQTLTTLTATSSQVINSKK